MNGKFSVLLPVGVLSARIWLKSVALASQRQHTATVEAEWNASGTRRPNPPGIYFVRMQTPERAFMRRLVVIPN